MLKKNDKNKMYKNTNKTQQYMLYIQLFNSVNLGYHDDCILMKNK